jgi:hypothetical protein
MISKTRKPVGRRPASREVRDLIFQMVAENPLAGEVLASITKIRARAEAEGLSVELTWSVWSTQIRKAPGNSKLSPWKGSAPEKPIEAGPSYWQEKHRLLDERLSKTSGR